ncbi:MAG: L-fucose/L-arabinose isomerase family protein [Planctomycetota bacterium]|jgi:L-fucose isomerase-like protein
MFNLFIVKDKMEDQGIMTATDTNVRLIAIARTTFDIELARRLAGEVKSGLSEAGVSLTGPEAFVSELEDAQKISRELTRSPPDLLILLQATFADSTLAVQLARSMQSPVLLWGLPEALTGERLRLNSLCGINLAAHAFRRESIDYEYVFASPDNPAALQFVQTLAGAGRVRRLLRSARIGRVGDNPAGFDSCKFDADALKTHFGVEIIQVGLDRIFQLARQADSQAVDALFRQLREKLSGLDDLDQIAVRKTLASYLALKQISTQENLSGMGVQCWPQFFTELQCAACGAMSMLSDELTPCSCEADINGTITQLILQGLSGAPAFGSDLVSVDTKEDTAVLWHCGLAPLSMADSAEAARATIHSNRKLPLLMEFALKPGRITIARLSEASGDFRLVAGSAEILKAPLSFSGTSGVVRFERPIADILDTIMKQGLEHHFSITYGDYTDALHMLAKQLGLEVVEL